MSRFVDRELTVQEFLWTYLFGKGDVEAAVLFVEARRVDSTFDIRSLPMSQFHDLVQECISAVRSESGYSQMDIKKLVLDCDEALKNRDDGPVE